MVRGSDDLGGVWGGPGERAKNEKEAPKLDKMLEDPTVVPELGGGQKVGSTGLLLEREKKGLVKGIWRFIETLSEHFFREKIRDSVPGPKKIFAGFGGGNS